MKVGYLGPDPVTYGYEAAEKFFGTDSSIEYSPFNSHESIVEAVSIETIDSGIVAIENVIDGIIVESIRAVEENHNLDVKVYGEVVVPIEHYYLRREVISSEPTKVYSHPSALRQCHKFILTLKDKNIEIVPVESTSKAAMFAIENNDFAAIASKKAMDSYNLIKIGPDSIMDRINNITRFWVIGKHIFKKCEEIKEYKTCFLINLDQPVPGGLCKSLEIFAKRAINLLFIYSNPIPGRKWEYTFMVEFSGHFYHKNIQDAYTELRESGLMLHAPLLVGSYPNVTIEQKLPLDLGGNDAR